MDMKKVEVTGTVVREKVEAGSKSERNAVVLKTDQGETFILRRHDGPTFGDEKLDPLVGGKITTSGVVLGKTLIMKEWGRSR